jgi:hypothetical protein
MLQGITGMRLSELSNTISTNADKTWCPAPSCAITIQIILLRSKIIDIKITTQYDYLKMNKYVVKHTWSSACLSSLRRLWKRSLNTNRIATKDTPNRKLNVIFIPTKS